MKSRSRGKPRSSIKTRAAKIPPPMPFRMPSRDEALYSAFPLLSTPACQSPFRSPCRIMPDNFPYDVFLSHSAKDKAVVRPLAERLRADGVIHKAEGERMKDETELQPSSFLLHTFPSVLCMSANAFGSDWAQLESGTFRFRAPLNKERRFLP